MSMQNIGIADRIVRIILAVIFIIMGLALSSWWLILAVIALVTGIIGWCPIYAIFGCGTYPNQKRAKKSGRKK